MEAIGLSNGPSQANSPIYISDKTDLMPTRDILIGTAMWGCIFGFAWITLTNYFTSPCELLYSDSVASAACEGVEKVARSAVSFFGV